MSVTASTPHERVAARLSERGTTQIRMACEVVGFDAGDPLRVSCYSVGFERFRTASLVDPTTAMTCSISSFFTFNSSSVF